MEVFGIHPGLNAIPVVSGNVQADPEIQAILKDPQMNIVLMNIQEKPELIHE